MLSPRLTALVAELQSISPMPDDETLNKLPDDNDPLEKLQHILTTLRKELQSHYPVELIPFFLNVFGVGDGNGVFWSMLHLIEQCPHLEDAYPLIQQATKSANAGTRKWCCFLLGRRRQKEDEPFLVARLQDEIAQVRAAALVSIIMLSQHYTMKHHLPLIEPLLQDKDKEVSATASDAWEMLNPQRN
ncbi:MAG TPA: HEAT repeat domain-containing protein [Ktedonobacteraceae bacterium]|nr:HEAT repeat domain-containing protein [Ktedonobacteraceae bacterium]